MTAVLCCQNAFKCLSFDSRPAAQIKFYFRGRDVQNTHQTDKCDQNTGFCNSTATFSFDPINSR